MKHPFAIGYVRVSSFSQVSDGHGLDIQQDKIRAWCAYQGLALVSTEEDAGVSGASTDHRPGLRRALKAVLEAGQGAVLVIYKLDRLGRSAIDVQEVLAVLLDAGVRVVSLADGVDSASGMGAALLKLLTSILSTFAEMEREAIRVRLLDGRRRADAENRIYASEPRYGRRVADENDEVLETNENETRAIRRIRELRVAGTSYRTIIATLEAEGIRPRRASRWSLSVVHRIAMGKREPRRTNKTMRIERARALLLSNEAA